MKNCCGGDERKPEMETGKDRIDTYSGMTEKSSQNDLKVNRENGSNHHGPETLEFGAIPAIHGSLPYR